MIEDIVKKDPSLLTAPDLLIMGPQIILLLYLAIDWSLRITCCKKPLHMIFHMIHPEVEVSFLKDTMD